MAEPSAPLVNPLCVISPYYCAPYPVDLAIVRKVLTISDGNFVVTDAKGNIIFKVKGVLLTLLHQRRIIVDAAGNPVVTIRQKVNYQPLISDLLSLSAKLARCSCPCLDVIFYGKDFISCI